MNSKQVAKPRHDAAAGNRKGDFAAKQPRAAALQPDGRTLANDPNSSMVVFKCPQCKAKLAASADVLRKSAHCPRCNQKLRAAPAGKPAEQAALGDRRNHAHVPDLKTPTGDPLQQATRYAVAIGIAVLLTLGFVAGHEIVWTSVDGDRSSTAQSQLGEEPSDQTELAPTVADNDAAHLANSIAEFAQNATQPLANNQPLPNTRSLANASGGGEQIVSPQPATAQSQQIDAWEAIAAATMQARILNEPATQIVDAVDLPLRRWIDDTGRFAIDAQLDSTYQLGTTLIVRLRAEDRTIDLPIYRLGADERRYILAMRNAQMPPAEAFSTGNSPTSQPAPFAHPSMQRAPRLSPPEGGLFR